MSYRSVGYDRGGRDGYDRGGRDGYDRGGRGGYDRGGRDGYDRGGRDGYNRGGRDGYNRGGRGGGSFRGGNDTGGRGRGRGGGFRGQSAPLPPPKLDGEGAIFPLSVKEGTKAYRYDVSIIFFTTDRDGNELQVDLADKKRDNRMREVCYQIISVVYEETHDFGVRDLEIVYDNQNTLYTPRRFKPLSYDVEKTQLPTDIQSYITGSGSLKVTITQNAEMPEVDISNMEQYQSRELLLTENQTVRQVLEMILSQNALNSGEYNFVGDGQLYRIRSDPIERGLCTRNGIHKGVRIIDYNGKVTPALVIDIKRSPFYEVCDNFLTNVKKFVTEPNNRRQWEDADEFFKNLKVYPVYASHRILKFSGFTKKDVKDITVNLEDGPVSMAQFFRSKKGITLQNTNYPAMIAANGAGEFPLEVLRVLPNQHVNLEHVSDFLRNQVHRRNSVEPEKRYNAILEELRGLEIRSNVTKAFGIDFLSTENKTVTVLRFNRPKKPTIMLGGGATVQPAFDGRFDLGMSPYLKPAEIGRWGVMHALSSGRDGCDPAVIKNFVVNFERAARARGIKFTGSALIMEFDSSAPFNVWDEKFKFFKEKQASFIILIDTKTPRSSNSHGFLKLFESLYKVLTQHITYKIACDVADNRSRQTLANILHKTNVKNGGINYKPMFENVGPLDINSGKVLVIAYDVSHPGGLIPEEDVQKQTKKPDQDKRRNDSNDSPSVVGLVANIVEDPASFVGDFFYQEARREAVNGDELRVYVKRFLEQLKKNRPNKPLPSTIVVLRDGVSEGQFRMVFEEELPRIRSACTDFDSKYKPKFVFALTTKRHHKRFFEGGSGSAIVNPAAGSFVDSAVVRPDCDEFYMACHKTIKGTAKFVQVSVICNEPQVKLTEIKSFLHSLSYGHQIVTSPVSLPTPVYQADDLATRGREVFNVCRKYAPTRFEHVDGHINYTLASHMLNYTSSNLGNIRFNA